MSRYYALVAALALATIGCGRPATHEECLTIFKKSAEVELKAQDVTDPTLVSKRIDVLYKERGEELIGKCVGRRITEDALACVKQSTTSADIDRCLY
jgi:hypothetical protein